MDPQFVETTIWGFYCYRKDEAKTSKWWCARTTVGVAAYIAWSHILPGIAIVSHASNMPQDDVRSYVGICALYIYTHTHIYTRIDR